MSKKILAVIFSLVLGLLLFPATGLSAIYDCYQDGPWNVNLTWHVGGIPTPNVPGRTDQANIYNGHTVTISGGADINTLEIGSGNGLNIGNGSLTFQLDPACITPASHDVLNNGTIGVGSAAGPGEMISRIDTVTFQGSGTLILGGHPGDSLNNAGFGGGNFINSPGHTIRGGGSLAALSVNQGNVVADNGNLWISGRPLDNNGGTLSASGSGNALVLYAYANVNGGVIKPQDDGKVALASGAVAGDVFFGPGPVDIGLAGEFASPGFYNTVTLSSGTTVTILENSSLCGGPYNNPTTLINNGAINMTAPDPDHPAYVNGYMTLQGPGTLTLGGAGNTVSGVTNSASHTIQGGGSVWSVENNGLIHANNGTLEVEDMTGTGTVSVADGATVNLANGNLETGDLTMSLQSNLAKTTGGVIDLKRNFSFAQADPGRWTGNIWLYMTGQGPWQTIEVGGQDYGAVAAGLTNNFALEGLRLNGTGTQAKLVDQIDNGHRASGREVLYVHYLQVYPNTTLNLNGTKLYATRSGTMYRVMAGQGSLYGGGKIIDTAGAGPGTKLLLLLE